MTASSLSLPVVLPIENSALHKKIQHALDTKTKPVGSLGRLEALALQMGLIFNTTTPELKQAQMLVFAADHGIAKNGVSAFPQEVTWQMADNILQGGAAISVLCKQHNIDLTLIDCAIAQPVAPHPHLISKKINPNGSADASVAAAMTTQECIEAIGLGIETVQSMPGNCILLGELGIGNTSSAALLLAKIANLPIEECTGAGTGMQGEALQHKINVLSQAISTHAHVNTPFDVLAAVGGFEIAAMVGAALEAAKQRRVIVVDGFVVSSAILVAAQFNPHVLDYCIFSHRSFERGHQLMLEQMNAKPLLQMDLRLGEGSGAALAWPIIESSCFILSKMASFSEAKVSTAF